jgi:glycine cleavage system transcriptional repressor
MARFTLHAVAPDRPGIVAAVTQSLVDIGCNFEDSRMSLLHGQFSIVLVLDAPGTSSGTMIEEALAPLLEQLALQLFVRPIPDGADDIDLGNLVFISVHGADQPGTVARIARAIAGAGGNIVDLVGHVVLAGAETPSHLELTAGLASDAVPGLRVTLEALAVELGMRCDVRDGATRRV